MKNRLFEDHATLTLEQISEKVNQLFEENFKYFEISECIKKWNSFPIIFLEKKVIKKKFLEMVIYIDELELSLIDKISYITTLTAMIELGKVNITKIEEGDILTLVSYLDSVTVDSLKEVIFLLNRPELLLAVRSKSLDITERMFTLRWIDDLSIDFVANALDEKEVKRYVDAVLQLLEKVDYYQLLDITGYSAYEEARHEELQKQRENEKLEKSPADRKKE